MTLRTVKNWIEKAEELGGLVPFETENPDDLLEWYRDAFGKAPKGEIETRARELRIEAGLEVVDQVEIDLGPIEVIKKALERVGMDLTFSRIVEEEERAAKMYEVLRVRGVSTSEARRQWKEASEMKRAAQKGDDAVQVGLQGPENDAHTPASQFLIQQIASKPCPDSGGRPIVATACLSPRRTAVSNADPCWPRLARHLTHG